MSSLSSFSMLSLKSLINCRAKMNACSGFFKFRFENRSQRKGGIMMKGAMFKIDAFVVGAKRAKRSSSNLCALNPIERSWYFDF